ncbi:MAG: ribosomal-protein-alanine N-acetyltransferase [Gammaproteobacteria bacterium]|nr:MAG: ribosomal-protein-alanine N-acetyltransferase [Gammaproteobacteria bacterium]
MLRTFFKSDVPHVLRIEQMVNVVPWTEETFMQCFRAGYVGWVMEVDKKVIGFIIIAMQGQECHILNVGVARDHQRQGIGRTLLEQVLSHAKKEGISIAYLEVRRSNSKAISLYRNMSFRPVGERKDYYPTVAGHEDALVFAKSL